MAPPLGKGIHSLSAHPLADESLVGFIFRLAKRRHAGSASSLAARVGFERLSNKPQPAWVEALAVDARIPASEIWAVANGPQDDATGMFRGIPLPSGYFDRRGASDYRVCPECLVESPYHRAIWTIACVAVCPVHDKVLIDTCRACGEPLRFVGTDMFLCPCLKGRLDRMRTTPVDHDEARGTRVVYGLLGDQRFTADAGYARTLEPLADLETGTAVDFLYRVGLHRISPRRALFSVQHAGELAWEAHVALNRGLAVAEDWPRAFVGVLDNIRRHYPAFRSVALNRSAGPVERWLDKLAKGTAGTIRGAVVEYRKQVEDERFD
jgi:hypothetical protein